LPKALDAAVKLPAHMCSPAVLAFTIRDHHIKAECHAGCTAASGDFAFPQTGTGWIGFAAAAAFYGFAKITSFIAISMIGPVRASLFSYFDAVISAILGVVVLGQGLLSVQVAGIALVVIALLSATVQRKPASPES
jgi:drug/metabolite transporter (DMT)-like permease